MKKSISEKYFNEPKAFIRLRYCSIIIFFIGLVLALIFQRFYTIFNEIGMIAGGIGLVCFFVIDAKIVKDSEYDAYIRKILLEAREDADNKTGSIAPNYEFISYMDNDSKKIKLSKNKQIITNCLCRAQIFISQAWLIQIYLTYAFDSGEVQKTSFSFKKEDIRIEIDKRKCISHNDLYILYLTFYQDSKLIGEFPVPENSYDVQAFCDIFKNNA